jgi:hypothetical protein
MGLGEMEWRQEGPIEESAARQDAYLALREVFNAAADRASVGKGRERHANGEPFERQTIVKVLQTHGEHAWDGQVVKKMLEADRLSPEAGDNELLDCLVYLAARVVARRLGRQQK